jgi:hypothetical protein
LFGSQKSANAEIKKIPTKASPPALKDLALAQIKKASYPNLVLQTAEANMRHIAAREHWEQQATVPLRVRVPGQSEPFELYSYPEYSSQRQQIEPRFIDPTHILTNIRSLALSKGIPKLGCKKNAFLEVSEYDNDILNRAFVTHMVDKQSAKIAQRVFSVQVQETLDKLGHVDTATFVQHIRNFYEACDRRAISADERITHLVNMHKFITQNIDFDAYPPTGTKANNLSMVTFEAILTNISGKHIFFYIILIR